MSADIKNMLAKRDLLGINLTINSKKELIDYLTDSLIKNREPLVIFTPNPEITVQAQDNPAFKAILTSADVCIPDGIGLVWAARRKGFQIERVPGVEFMQKLIEKAAMSDWTVGFIGGRKDSAQRTLTLTQKLYPSFHGWVDAGPQVHIDTELTLVGADEESYFKELVQKIISTKTRMVFVAMGAPKQEFFIARLRVYLKNRSVVLMSVGGAFDTFSRLLPRAPKIWRRFGLEWLWRLMLEPWRITRQIRLLRFVKLALSQTSVLQ